jgi:hypothetical protein
MNDCLREGCCNPRLLWISLDRLLHIPSGTLHIIPRKPSTLASRFLHQIWIQLKELAPCFLDLRCFRCFAIPPSYPRRCSPLNYAQIPGTIFAPYLVRDVCLTWRTVPSSSGLRARKPYPRQDPHNPAPLAGTDSPALGLVRYGQHTRWRGLAGAHSQMDGCSGTYSPAA